MTITFMNGKATKLKEKIKIVTKFKRFKEETKTLTKKSLGIILNRNLRYSWVK